MLGIADVKALGYAQQEKMEKNWASTTGEWVTEETNRESKLPKDAKCNIESWKAAS